MTSRRCPVSAGSKSLRFEIEDAARRRLQPQLPVLGFGWTVRAIVRGLTDDPEGVFTFTESDAKIVFTRENSEVRIEATYTDATARVPYEELAAEADRFLRRVIRDFGDRVPELAKNPAVAAVSRELAVPP
jgi:hypothetical protein